MPRSFALLLFVAFACALAAPAAAAPAAARPRAASMGSATRLTEDAFSGLAFRGIGPALTSGRVVDVAVVPGDKSCWYVATAYGGVWKTTNAGTSWTPVFDKEGTSSIGCVTIDPRQPLTVWVGSGENNSQRSVGWGDGVYRSDDGGRNWKNMGLKASEHIGRIAVDPRHSEVVFVAAQGPLWASGGDRGLYRTRDGGKTWTRVLDVNPWTGANEVWFDPRNPDVMYATTYQRHRRVWTLIDGGPGSGIWKSTDGGENWKRLAGGLPKEDMGRIGLAISPVEADVIVAVIESANGAGGTYRSADGGANWEKMGDWGSSSPQYYNELFADPKQAGRVYAVDTYLQVTDDYGRTWRRAGERAKHVDNHIVWIDPDDTRHLLVGCDGGLYESFDRCSTWKFFANLPITQFYKLEVDNSLPFYFVYGGTQDNNTQGGPSRTNNVHGIRNSDWFITTGGDGFQPRVDPVDPNIVYSESQHAGIVRYDRRNGEQLDIQPQPEPGEPAMHWNWDTPLIISPHAPSRLYMAAQRIFRSDDHGDSWKPVSPDLTRQIDRNRLPVMGRVWSVDAVAKNASTSFYGNIVALSESPLKEGLLYAGTDDGLIQASEDGGAHWRRIDGVPGVGEYAYVSRVVASQHAAATVYATFDRHKMGDFKPYVYRSTDGGRSWTNITGNLPANGPVYAFAEDAIRPDLLFAGTEFGVFFTPDGGRKWIALKGGLPVQCIRDLAIQKRDDDLVLATFGRGFYVLDDLSALRLMASESKLAAEAELLPVRKVPLYVPAGPLGGSGRAEQGEEFFIAPNPPFGAVFTAWVGDTILSRRDARRRREAKEEKAGANTYYPSWDSLRAEAREEAPALVFTVTNEAGEVVRRVETAIKPGFQRVAWDLRWATMSPPELTPRPRSAFDDTPDGPLAAPGTYRVAMAKRVDGVLTAIGTPQSFVCEPVGEASLPAKDRAELLAFERRTARLQRATLGAVRALAEMQQRVTLLVKALATPAVPAETLRNEAIALQDRMRALGVELSGDTVVRERSEADVPSLTERLNQVISGHWNATSAPTGTHRRQVEIVTGGLDRALASLRTLRTDLAALESRAEAAGAPWTPGRLPEFKPE